ncbi:MAG: glycosyltransferase [Candidatus Hodarchaeota archaeon]
MNKPKISVVIPTLNEEKVLGRTLQALKEQTFKAFEVIISDSFSKDRTREIAYHYGARVVDSPNTKGEDGMVINAIGQARNIGGKSARGSIIIFLDADCIPSRNLLSSVIERFQNKQVALVTCKHEISGYYPLYSILIKWQFYFSALSYHFGIIRTPGWMIATRKVLFSKVNGFNELYQLGEDHDFSARLSSYGKLVYLREAHVKVDPRRVEKWGIVKLYILYALADMSRKTSIPMRYEYPPVRGDEDRVPWSFIFNQFRIYSRNRRNLRKKN